MFGIENAKDRLGLLKADYAKLVQYPLNISLAEKACSDAWHLNDWVYKEKQTLNNLLTLEEFRKVLYEECPEMRILHDIVNTSKHKELSRPKARIIKTKKHSGAFSSDFSNDFDISRLEVYLEKGSKIDIDDLLKIAIDYWSKHI